MTPAFGNDTAVSGKGVGFGNAPPLLETRLRIPKHAAVSGNGLGLELGFGCEPVLGLGACAHDAVSRNSRGASLILDLRSGLGTLGLGVEVGLGSILESCLWNHGCGALAVDLVVESWL